MLSKWFIYKEKAINLRKQGTSIRAIERKWGIPRSTLSGWFRKIQLTNTQKIKIFKNASILMSKARIKAVIWHNKQKKLRLNKARKEAKEILSRINTKDKNILELSLSMLYLGEGSKTNHTSMGNSNPLILKFFIKCMRILFGIQENEFKCDLHLRSDQNEKKAISYWSNELGIPKNNFTYMKDKRTAKSKTYTSYMGVCVVRCGKIAVQRRIVHLAEEFSKIVISS